MGRGGGWGSGRPLQHHPLLPPVPSPGRHWGRGRGRVKSRGHLPPPLFEPPPPPCAVKQSLCLLFKTLASGAIMGRKVAGLFYLPESIKLGLGQRAAGLWAAAREGTLGAPLPSEDPGAPVPHLTTAPGPSEAGMWGQWTLRSPYAKWVLREQSSAALGGVLQSTLFLTFLPLRPVFLHSPGGRSPLSKARGDTSSPAAGAAAPPGAGPGTPGPRSDRKHQLREPWTAARSAVRISPLRTWRRALS